MAAIIPYVATLPRGIRFTFSYMRSNVFISFCKLLFGKSIPILFPARMNKFGTGSRPSHDALSLEGHDLFQNSDGFFKTLALSHQPVLVFD